MSWKQWDQGEIVEAGDFQEFIQDQVVQSYANASERNTTLGTAVSEGMISYREDANVVEVYDGANWVGVSAAGDITAVTAGTALTGGGTTGDVTLDVDIAAVGSAVSIEASQISDVTATAAELNILDGVTSTTAELNILDGVTSTTAELNILDGVTADATELNLLDGVTATTAELNHTDGVTSNIQTQLDDKQDDVITTEGDLVTGDASGDPIRLAIGSADQVLTSNGTTAVWADAAGGGGGGAAGLTELINQPIPAAASVTLTGLSGYSFYHIEIDSARLSIGGAVEFQEFNTDSTGHVIGLEYENNGAVFRYTQNNAKFKANVNSSTLDIFMNVQIFNAGDNGIASANFVGGSNSSNGPKHRWGQARITKNSLPLDEIVINASGSDFQATGNIRVYGG